MRFGRALCSAHAATEPADHLAAQLGVQPCHELLGHEVQLLGPDGGLASDREDAVTLGRWRGRSRDHSPDGRRPSLLYATERARGRELPREGLQRVADRPWRHPAHAASASLSTTPGETASLVTPDALAPGTWSRSVVAMMLCPAADSSAESSSRRSAS